MPERPQATPVRYSFRRTGVKLSLLLLVGYIAYTETHPDLTACVSTQMACRVTTERYATAIAAYRHREGHLPASLDYLVPNYLSEHQSCTAVSSEGWRSLMGLRLVSALADLVDPPAPPERPEYLIIQLASGEQTFQLRCNRPHELRAAYRGDSGGFLASGEP